MTALELIGLVNQALFVGLFVAVLWHALRQPTRARIDTALLFGSIALVVVVARAVDLLGLGSPSTTAVTLALLSVAPFAMLRLVDDFSGMASWLRLAGTAAFIGVVAISLLAFGSEPVIAEVVAVAWFGAVGGYAAVAFARQGGRTRGITRRRMAAVAFGAGLFIVAIVVALLGAIVDDDGAVLPTVIQVAALASVIAFFLGFMPPTWVRRAWREPDLRAFLERSIHLTGIREDRDAVRELQQAAADTFGASGAAIGIADAERRVIRYVDRHGEWVEYADDRFIAGQAFTRGRRVVAMDASRIDPDGADIYRGSGANTVIAAPINTEERRLGVLAIYAERAPVFIEDDLWLLELLADQTAVLLDARRVAASASDLRAREETARLKEEFLSAAAHDLRTPLTVVLGQIELIERRLARDPAAPVDAAGIARLGREARHLRDLVSELLDAQRLEQGLATMEMEEIDLRDVVDAVRQRHLEHGVPLALESAPGPVMAAVDRPRIEQVIENLLENAFKYGADDRPPQLRVWRGGDEARIAVIDHGVGIPEDERDRVFERFYRAGKAQSITDTGMGLGLYICRRIVEQHGGRIWADATPGGGTTITVALARSRSAAPEPAVEAVGSPAPPVIGSEVVADA